jgi:hypothetical protein
MAKAPVKVNEHFVVGTDEKGVEREVIYDPPLLLKCPFGWSACFQDKS